MMMLPFCTVKQVLLNHHSEFVNQFNFKSVFPKKPCSEIATSAVAAMLSFIAKLSRFF